MSMNLKPRSSTQHDMYMYICVLLFIVCLLFFLNTITPYVWDDYVYKFRFDNGERITSVADIFPSLDAHAKLYNGRLVAHFFAHLFLLLPKVLFNIVNSFLFTFVIALITFFSRPEPGRYRTYAITAVFVFCGLWLYSPAFGQVFLWLDGACNYLWGIAFNLCLLLPFYILYTQNRNIIGRFSSVLFLIFAFLCGAFQENMSVATIFMCTAFLILHVFVSKKKAPPIYCLAILAAALGLLFMATRPAESTKMNVISIRSLLLAGHSVYWSFRHMWVPFFVYALCFFYYVMKRRWLPLLQSLVFFLAAVGANLLMLFASFYPARCASPTAVLILISDAVLLQDLFRTGKKASLFVLSVFFCVLLGFTGRALFHGVSDLVDTHREVLLREEQIIEARESGMLDVEVPIYQASTKYSPLHLELGEYPGEFASKYMADYYGVRSIRGIPPVQ